MDILKMIFKNDLRGHDYIQARGLSPQVVKDRHNQCHVCKHAEQSQNMLYLINNWRNAGAL